MAGEMVSCFTPPPRLFLLVWPVQKEQERHSRSANWHCR